MAAKKRTSKKPDTRKRGTLKQAEVSRELVEQVRALLKPLPIEVLGHLESQAMCCRNGTVALVKIDYDRVINPKK